MEFWDQIGNFAAFMPGAPALAVDMATNGPNPDMMGYDLAYGLQATPQPISLYPEG
jgi:hypothetical protein